MSKDILKLFCNRATTIARNHGIDVDVESTIAIYMQAPENKPTMFWNVCSTMDEYTFESMYYPLKKFCNDRELKTSLFADNIPAIVHDTVLKSFAEYPAKIQFKKDCYEDFRAEHERKIKNLHERIDSCKAVDLDWVKNNPELVASFKAELEQIESKFKQAWFEFNFMPKMNISNYEQAKIWCDLNSKLA